NFPYFSRDIAEFWRRWHISLTTWFRDYIYIPLGGSRCSKGKIIRNTFIIFLLSGFWHGANLTFIAWGAYHALLFLPLILMNKNRKYIDTVASGHLFPSIKEFGQMAFTFFLVVFGWIFFRADTITDAWKYIVKIFSPSLFTIPELIKVPICCFIFVLFAVEWLQRNKEHGFDFKGIQKGWIRWTIYLITILAILLFMGNNEQFIYFQF
ncbi:MAG: MBOAT family O-acyltransferase, partial [Bacteroidales bacterium]